MIRGAFARRRVKAAIGRIGQSMTFRRITSLGGPHPQLNPPTTSADLALDGNHSAGATSINLKATSISGFLAVGDSIVLSTGPEPYVVRVQALPSNNHYAAAIDPPLHKGYADGTAASLLFAADVALHARVADFNNFVIDGTLIQQGDVNLVVPALSLPWSPKITDKVLIDAEGDKVRSIIVVKPNYTQDVVAFYNIQVR